MLHNLLTLLIALGCIAATPALLGAWLMGMAAIKVALQEAFR